MLNFQFFFLFKLNKKWYLRENRQGENDRKLAV